jgi:hypothetical protein
MQPAVKYGSNHLGIKHIVITMIDAPAISPLLQFPSYNVRESKPFGDIEAADPFSPPAVEVNSRIRAPFLQTAVDTTLGSAKGRPVATEQGKGAGALNLSDLFSPGKP